MKTCLCEEVVPNNIANINWDQCKCGMFLNSRGNFYKYYEDYIVYFTLANGGGISIYPAQFNKKPYRNGMISTIIMSKQDMLNLTYEKILSIIKFASILK
jgi:hypothetical protein